MNSQSTHLLSSPMISSSKIPVEPQVGLRVGLWSLAFVCVYGQPVETWFHHRFNISHLWSKIGWSHSLKWTSCALVMVIYYMLFHWHPKLCVGGWTWTC